MLQVLCIKPSSKLIIFSTTCYLLSAVALLISSLVIFWKIVCVAFLLGSAKQYYQRYIFFRHPLSIVALWKESDIDFWALKLANTEIVFGELQANSLITRFLVILNFKSSDDLLRVLMTPESIDYHEYRKLMVYFTHGTPFGTRSNESL